MPRPPIDAAAVRRQAEMVRYEVAEDRAATLAPALDSVLASLDALDAVELGETPPASTFDPRWER